MFSTIDVIAGHLQIYSSVKKVMLIIKSNFNQHAGPHPNFGLNSLIVLSAPDSTTWVDAVWWCWQYTNCRLLYIFNYRIFTDKWFWIPPEKMLSITLIIIHKYTVFFGFSCKSLINDSHTCLKVQPLKNFLYTKWQKYRVFSMYVGCMWLACEVFAVQWQQLFLPSPGCGEKQS